MLKYGAFKSRSAIKTLLLSRSRTGRPFYLEQSRYYASVTDLSSLPKAGDHIHGFICKQVKSVPELHLTAVQLEHEQTGAEYLHVARDDKNNVFAINFKTNPTDSTGLPHILEHVTLCGSEKYPVRDPFFKMMPRSLANFMNAFTSSDYTSYPFATTNLQDYKNLSSVYLDATLHPLLKHSDFLQEGWRLGPENPRELATEDSVKFKGVVYNEMKGQMSDASYLFYIRFRDHIFPSLNNSGGDPEKMTDLTYEQLVDFSKKHYHPSNAKIFSYGDLALSDQLKFIDQELAKFTRTAPEMELKSPLEMTTGPIFQQVSGPLDTMQSPDRQIKSSVSWLGCKTSDIVESFGISIMMSLLMSGYSSPLYEGLIQSGQGTNFSPNSGYDSSARLGILSIGLDGMKSEGATNLKETIHGLLREKAHEAFAPAKVDGYMHQMEIALKHKTASFGMSTLEKVLPGWFNGIDPIKVLSWNEILGAFKERLENPGYLESLVEKYLLNDRYMHFTMLPSESYNDSLERAEEKRRQRILDNVEKQASTPEAALSQLRQQELDLLTEQEQAQTLNLESLPTLRVNDIPKQKESKPVSTSRFGEVDCLWRETETNGITYFQAKHILDGIPNDLRLLLPLYTECLMRLGTTKMSVAELEAEILLKTGGISVTPFVRPDPGSLDAHQEGLLLDGYALDKNVPAMLDLLKNTILDVNFAEDKALPALQEMLMAKTAGALDSVAESGHHFAVQSASAGLTKRGLLQEQLSGLTQIEATAQMLDAARSNPVYLRQIVEKLKLIQSIAISNSSRLSLRVVCEPTTASQNQSHLQSFLQALPSSAPMYSPTPSTLSGTSMTRRSFFDLPFQVSYTGSCLQTAPYTSPDKAPLTVLGQLLTHNYMHSEIREKGGAYGASASASPISGLFTMSSYRDPNPRNSLKVFRHAGDFACNRDWSLRELEESKLSIFQQIDAPTSVSSHGAKQFMYGITEEMEQETRERLLEVKEEDVQRVAKKYLVDAPEEMRSVCVLGEKKEWVAKDDQEWSVRKIHISAQEEESAQEAR